MSKFTRKHKRSRDISILRDALGKLSDDNLISYIMELKDCKGDTEHLTMCLLMIEYGRRNGPDKFDEFARILEPKTYDLMMETVKEAGKRGASK